MEINADLRKRAIVKTAETDWVPSPAAGVERKMLDRDGDEVARATSLVRYAAGSAFDTHAHDLGEEFLVLEGTFSDEHGDYPAGTYVRNPPGTSHSPYSEDGCIIFVKLRQFEDGDDRQFSINTNEAEWRPRGLPGLTGLALHEWGAEIVRLVRYEPGARIADDSHPGGEEVFVLEGELRDEFDVYPAGTWLRQPDGSRHAPYSDTGCLLYVKRGHLPAVEDRSEDI